MKDLSIIIVSYNTKKLLLDLLHSIKQHTKGIDYEVIVVDNASGDGSESLALIKNKTNVGFAKANNQGIKVAKGRYILLLNSDTLIHDNLLSELVLWMDKHQDLGAVTCALKNKDGSLQGTGGYFPTLLRVASWMTIQDLPLVDRFIKPFHPAKEKSFAKGMGFYKKAQELDWVTGAFFFARSEVFEKNLFDEDYFMYVEEVDLCFRIKRRGWKIMYLPQFSITHLGSASGTRELSVISEYDGVKRFFKKFYPSWQLPIVRLFLKIGSLWRLLLFGRIYARAFKEA